GITISGADAANYQANTTATTAADIIAKPVTATADAKTKTYGQADPPFTYTPAGLESGDSLTGVTCDVSTAHGNVGSYSVVCSGNTNNNYAASYVPGTLTVNAKAAVATADAKTKTYGQADPALTGTLSGFEAADGVTASYSRTAGETVGSYTISASLAPGAVLSNYDITYNTAAFNITKKTVTIKADNNNKTYGTAADP